MNKLSVVSYSKFFIILVLLAFCCTNTNITIASEKTAIEDDDFEIEENLYKNFNKIKIYDPYEKFNRVVYDFNKVVDKFIIKPPAKMYHIVMPIFVKCMMTSFVDNLFGPLNTVYGIIQIKPEIAFDSFFRFFINSTLGILGLFDVAESFGLKKQRISFGDVLKYYGVKEGPYLVLPIYGPSTLRSSVGIAIDVTADIFNFVQFKNRDKFQLYRGMLELVVRREKLIGADKMLSQGSLDEYIALRNFYYQKISKSFQGD